MEHVLLLKVACANASNKQGHWQLVKRMALKYGFISIVNVFFHFFAIPIFPIFPCFGFRIFPLFPLFWNS